MLKKDFETFDKGFHTHSTSSYQSSDLSQSILPPGVKELGSILSIRMS